MEYHLRQLREVEANLHFTGEAKKHDISDDGAKKNSKFFSFIIKFTFDIIYFIWSAFIRASTLLYALLFERWKTAKKWNNMVENTPAEKKSYLISIARCVFLLALFTGGWFTLFAVILKPAPKFVCIRCVSESFFFPNRTNKGDGLRKMYLLYLYAA